MKADIPAEAMFIFAILLIILSLIIYSMILKKLSQLITGKAIRIFPVIGCLALIGVAVFHIYRIFFYFPQLETAGPAALIDLIIILLSLSRVESFFLLGAGLFSLLGGLLYYSATSR
jgi:hypothetical protein